MFDTIVFSFHRYKDAYNDYQLTLVVDSSVEVAYTARSRITRLLQDLDGHDWRSKLPLHPDAERVKAALAEQNRSGSLGGVPGLSTVVSEDQARVSGVSDSGVASLDGATSSPPDGSVSDTSNVGGSSVGETSLPEPSTDGGKRERKKDEERKEQTQDRVPEIPPVSVTATSTSAPQVCGYMCGVCVRLHAKRGTLITPLFFPAGDSEHSVGVQSPSLGSSAARAQPLTAHTRTEV